MENNKEYLALKVLRLTKPYFVMDNPVLLEESDLGYNEFFNNDNYVKSSSLPLDEILGLPTSFGNIYLGETFSSYITVINDGSQTCKDIIIKTNLQTATQQLPQNCNGFKVPTELEPGQNIDDIIFHEVKELGNHILICTVSYLYGNSPEKFFFKKFYKFTVSKPLDVKTKFFVEESSDTFMEAQIHNITGSSIFLEKVSLEPTMYYQVNEINPMDHKPRNASIVGSINCLKPNNIRQFLFRLSSRDCTTELSNLNQVGRLDIVWRTQMGEKGRLQTSTLNKPSNNDQNSVYSDIKLTSLIIPTEGVVGRKFSIRLKLNNVSERNLDLILSLNNSNHYSGLIWSGCIKKSLGIITPTSNIILDLELIPSITGLQTISELKVTDTFSKRDYKFNDIAQILILNH